MQIHLSVIPPPSIRRMAAELAKKYVSKYPHFFVVDNARLFPHITLFWMDINKSRYYQLEKVLAGVLRKQGKIPLFINRHFYSKINKGGWTGLKIRESRRLSFLRSETFRSLKDFSAKSAKLKKTFSPHITLTKFKKHSNAKLATKFSKIPPRYFTVNLVAICIDGPYRQVKKTIKIYKLS
ncbi:MAG: hypothetical protein A2722_03830 [Candidatus Doudnabacteria bacterium RIFCSPHIGHO2_01_FULL_50_11]|uniref:2'-5' RNA ligase n=1 Tax=Candidatus Doudnabacteria bacterium RIFCSPHIGHO2_01_FULL_50_11 TaxID=1817828 RepID=A0A1F5PF04_9BACT|nr:MAG: hypothetical protein A2722_03830 [Candidatus Doudnabacteria bacterium RIFCSPHIGHO2_01_FULL_50_11]